MMEIGGSHKRFALTVAQTIECMAPKEHVIEVLDFARAVGAERTDQWLKNTWNLALAHPTLTAWCNRALELGAPFLRSSTLLRVFFPDFLHRGMEYLRERSPDGVFATHFFCATIAALARIRYQLSYKVIVTMTDPLVGHPLWIEPWIDYLLVATPFAAEEVIKRGMPREKVVVISLPLREEFFAPLSQEEKGNFFLSHGLSKERLTLLFVAGGQGIGKIASYVKGVWDESWPVNLIVVCGKNEKLYRDLSALTRTPRPPSSLLVFGYVEHMSLLLAVSDLVITKAGPATVFEALARGCPLIFTHWVGYNEKGNLDFCLREGVGWYVPTVKSFLRLLKGFLDNPSLLREGRENLLRLQTSSLFQPFSRGAQSTASFLLGKLAPSSHRDQREEGNRHVLP